ncbi:MAG: helix-turn-helix domain-containing protein [Candidatus Omnitrophica bacterium]|nr:helix-turn-helix domain-containing protein [Candidatus Omnitrophota bacterium]
MGKTRAPAVITPAYLNLKQSAEYLGISEGHTKRIWPSWQRYGVVPARFPARTLRFKRSDLDRMIESLKVVKV